MFFLQIACRSPQNIEYFLFFHTFASLMKREFRTYYLLKPLSWIYALFTSVRNMMYDRGILPATRFPIPVISVGNITVGGTGKTPHTLFIASMLKDKVTTAVLSRGYGRLSKGFLLADEKSNSNLLGDEPLMIHNRLPEIYAAVDEDRVRGIKRLLKEVQPEVVILDDAFQHRRIEPSLNILLVNRNRNILNDCVMPAGRMRETAAGRSRADIIIVTKCPDTLEGRRMDEMSAKLMVHQSQKVFFSTVKYGDIYNPFTSRALVPEPEQQVLAITGIASPEAMWSKLEGLFGNVKKLPFKDHHRFTSRDIIRIEREVQSMGPDAVIVTTEKDIARLRSCHLSTELKERLFTLPVTIRFLRDEALFRDNIIEHIESFRKKQNRHV